MADGTTVSVLGLGAMGNALSARLLDADYPTTVWNRTSGRDHDLVTQGAVSATSAAEAVAASDLIVACLLDHASVHETLDPLTATLRGRTLVNLTTTTPNQSRELAAWADAHGITFLDGAIMAIPSMIGGTDAAILYSGASSAFEEYLQLLSSWATSTYYGEDAGMAALYDLAMLSGMYTMFAGFFHGAAMVGTEGVPATTYAKKAAPFLAAMTEAFEVFAAVIDGRDYAVDGQQSLEFSDLADLLQASADQGISAEPIAMVQALIRRQIDAGHGSDGFPRIYESFRNATSESRTV